MPANQNLIPDFISWNTSWSEFSKLFDTYSLESYAQSPVDMKSLLETNRKNLLALSEIGQNTFENMQDIMHRQSRMFSEILSSNSQLAREIMSEGTPEEKLAKNADMFKQIYERSYNNMKELSDMLNKAGDKTTGIISKRVSASLNEIKTSVAKPAKAVA